ncbi:MAG: dethiobiotin synthase [Candidatus Hydrogenedentota bacterium]
MQSRKMKSIFIAGTDTSCGKTLITGLLGKYLLDRGYNIITQKWVQSGKPSDIMIHQKIMFGTKTKIFADRKIKKLIQPYYFTFPASPHLSASIQKKKIRFQKIYQAFIKLTRLFDTVLVEGTGGLCVPLNHNDLLVDYIAKLKLPVILVTLNKLGTINHTLLSIEILKKRKIPIIGVIFNNIQKGNRIILVDNPEIIHRFGSVNFLGTLPFSKNIETLKQEFTKIGRRIERWITG